jgi:hypothetical protein
MLLAMAACRHAEHDLLDCGILADDRYEKLLFGLGGWRVEAEPVGETEQVPLRPMLYFFCRRRGGLSREDIEDAVQTVGVYSCTGFDRKMLRQEDFLLGLW